MNISKEWLTGGGLELHPASCIFQHPVRPVEIIPSAHSDMRVLALVLFLALAHTVASELVYRRAASDDVSVFELAKQVKSLDAEFSAGITAAVGALGDHAKAASKTYVDANVNLLKGNVDSSIAR